MPFPPPCDDAPLVLVAEDDDVLRHQITRAIGELGWLVRAAADGRALLTLLDGLAAHEGARFLVTDLRMPQLDGLDLLAELRLRKDRRLRTVVVTAFADEETRQTARALGASVIFSKPFDLDDLCTALQFLRAQSSF